MVCHDVWITVVQDTVKWCKIFIRYENYGNERTDYILTNFYGKQSTSFIAWCFRYKTSNSHYFAS